jgi:hypothetical protein
MKKWIMRTSLACLCFALAAHAGARAAGGALRAASRADGSQAGSGAAKSKRRPASRAKPRRPRGTVAPPLEGEWGGPHVKLDFNAGGAAIEFDCAHGTIEGGIRPGRDGRFVARGTHVDETGGPARDVSAVDEGGAGSPNAPGANGHPARYTGSVRGRDLRITVTLADTGRAFGTFRLTLGATPRLYKCRS